MNCRILEIDAPRKLSYSWVVGDTLDTVVTFTLTPTVSGTLLSLMQSGFKPDQKQNFGGARYGWTMMGGKLVDLLAEDRLMDIVKKTAARKPHPVARTNAPDDWREHLLSRIRTLITQADPEMIEERKWRKASNVSARG